MTQTIGDVEPSGLIFLGALGGFGQLVVIGILFEFELFGVN